MKAYYRESKEELIKELGANEKQGLTNKVAQEKLAQVGPNALIEGKKKSILEVFLEQFRDLMVIILIVAAVISAFTGNLESTAVIIVVLILNAILGTVQHVKAEKSLEALKSLSAPAAKVLRDGKKQEIAAKDVVPGDILLLEAGDLVTADPIRQKRLGERGQHDRQDGQHRQQRNASAAHAVGGRSGCIVDVGIAWFVSVGIVFRHVRSLPL